MYEEYYAQTVYYCPKCDRTIPKERLVEIDSELRERFGRSCLPSMSCPVCETGLIDLNNVRPGGERYVGKVSGKEA
jgi:hypothetical protein